MTIAETPCDRFAANLRHIRAKRGMSQEDPGRLAKMHPTEMSVLERGLREPRLGTLVRLSTVLEAPLNEFFKRIEWVPVETAAGRICVTVLDRKEVLNAGE